MTHYGHGRIWVLFLPLHNLLRPPCPCSSHPSVGRDEEEPRSLESRQERDVDAAARAQPAHLSARARGCHFPNTLSSLDRPPHTDCALRPMDALWLGRTNPRCTDLCLLCFLSFVRAVVTCCHAVSVTRVTCHPVINLSVCGLKLNVPCTVVYGIAIPIGNFRILIFVLRQRVECVCVCAQTTVTSQLQHEPRSCSLQMQSQCCSRCRARSAHINTRFRADGNTVSS